jgi:uncharacterized delta-60 repeat protein
MGRRACLAGVLGLFGLAAISAALAAPGQLDGGFGTGGKVRTDIGGADWASAVAIAPGGDVVVAGASGRDVAAARYDAAGRLDPTFGGGGTIVTDLGGDDSAVAVVVQPDNRIVAAGQRGPDLALARYLVNGTLDSSFDRDGVVVTDLGGEERAIALLLRPDGRLVVVGSSSDGLVLARYLRDGRLDAASGGAAPSSRGRPGSIGDRRRSGPTGR